MNEERIKEIILKEADAYLDEIADFIFTESQENIVKKGAIDEGTLLKSGNINRKFLEKEIVYSAPYAAFVEFGTEPHMPPVEPLEQWAKRKLGQEGIGWAIAKKIAKEGTEPKPFLRPAIDAAKAKYGGIR